MTDWRNRIIEVSAMRPIATSARLAAVPFANAKVALGTVTPGMRVVGLTKGQFSLLDLIAAVLEQVGPAEVMVSTWTPGKAEMNAVAALLDRHHITRFRLLVDRSFVTRHPEYVARVHAILGSEAIRQTRTHAKFALIAAGDFRITIRTSMNFNRNPRYEQFDLDDDAEIYAFFDAAVNELYDGVPPGLDAKKRDIERGFNRATMGTLFRMGNDTSIEMPNDDVFQFLGTEDLDELLASIEGNDG